MKKMCNGASSSGGMLLHFLLTAVFLNTPTEAALRCLYCNAAVSPADCDTVLKCGAHERCYVDTFVSATGTFRYNLGCRDENQCGISSSLGKRAPDEINADLHADEEPSFQLNITMVNSRSHLRTGTRDVSSKRSKELLVCSECCTGNLCSSTGCGNTGYISPRGPICFNCAMQLTPDDCSKIKLCSRGEVCMLLKTINPNSQEVRYTTKCEGEKRCNDEILKYKGLASLFIGKRRRDSLETRGSCLVQCCTTDMCNINCGNSTSLNSTGTPIPTTAMSQVSTPIQVTAAFCIYKSKMYNQGDVWQDGCQYNCTCEDARTGFYRCQDLCPVWNNLPAGCTLEKKPGECCSHPNCGGQILTPDATANTCYYGGKYYHQGEKWRDGCKYKCTCQDGKTGFYQCQLLCLQWTLPPSCHLDPAPTGKCCQVPVCPSNVQLQYPPGFVQE